MEEHHPIDGIKSKASLFGHPIHPMLIPFPIAFLVGLFVTDIVYWINNDPFWARVSLWLAVAGLVTGLLAAVFGIIDFSSIRRARAHSTGWIHAGGNVLAMLVTLVNIIIRWNDPADAVLPWGLTLSGLVFVLLLVTGWAGGELSYRFGIGVTPPRGQTGEGRIYP